MEKNDIKIVILMFVIIFVMFLTIYQITNFMHVYSNCKSYLDVIQRCGCYPWTKKDY